MTSIALSEKIYKTSFILLVAVCELVLDLGCSSDTHIMVLMHFKGMSWSKPTNNKTILPLCEGKSTFFFFRAFSRAFFASFRGSANTTDQDIRWHKGFSTVDSEENYPSRICLLHRERKTIIKQQHKKYFVVTKFVFFL